MLPEDELDFEDFGDLGEIDGPELTNEELEALEKELRFENLSTSNKLENASTSTPTSTAKSTAKSTATSTAASIATTSTTTTATTTAIAAAEKKRKENPDTVNNTLEEGETPSDSSSNGKLTPYSVQQQAQKFNKYNAHYKNNGYNQKGLYGQPSVLMNNMFPQFPQFTNRIYVNPKFNKGPPPQQMQFQQQQQRQFMEMETQRMLLMQKQLQQEQQRLADLDKKRHQVAENMRKKREQKDAQSGEKRLRPDEIDNDVHSFKRQERFAPSPAGGITIKGAAAARNNNLPSRNVIYQPPHERPHDRKLSTPFDKKPFEKPSITSRLGKPGNPTTTTAAAAAAPETTTTSVLPIAINGKSKTLVINGLSKGTKEQDIRAMMNGINGGAHDVKLDSNANSAIVVFPTVESAVTFRRKYNRIQMGESHINISFQK